MGCGDAHAMMHTVLDDAAEGTAHGELEAHLRRCPQCAAEWSRLKALDAVLRQESLVDPPASFTASTMRRIARDTRPVEDAPHPQVEVADALAVAGVALLAAAALFVAWGAGWSAVVARDAAVAAAGARLLASMVGLPAVSESVAVGLQAGLAMLVAVAWFGALVLPRRLNVVASRLRAR